MKNTTRVGIILGISVAFFVTEVAIGFYTKSLVLIADAFHYLTDIVAYTIAFVAAYLQENGQNSPRFTYAFHRAELVGAFFNGVFLLALALSIFLHSVERFVNVEVVESPLLVLIVGCVGLTLNVASAFVAHDHHGHGHGSHSNHSEMVDTQVPQGEDRAATSNHSSSYNVGLAAVLIHVLGDAVNNIGVIIAALVMWRTTSPSRFYVDPAISMAISCIIFAGAIPITLRAGRMLLEASPQYLDLNIIKEDLVVIPGVQSIHDLHVWHLSQSVILASLHVCISLETTLPEWATMEQALQHCFAAYGIHHVTISPEIQKGSERLANEDVGGCKFHSQDFGCSVSALVQVRQKSSV